MDDGFFRPNINQLWIQMPLTILLKKDVVTPTLQMFYERKSLPEARFELSTSSESDRHALQSPQTEEAYTLVPRDLCSACGKKFFKYFKIYKL